MVVVAAAGAGTTREEEEGKGEEKTKGGNGMERRAFAIWPLRFGGIRVRATDHVRLRFDSIFKVQKELESVAQTYL